MEEIDTFLNAQDLALSDSSSANLKQQLSTTIINNLNNKEVQIPFFWQLFEISSNEESLKHILNICFSHGFSLKRVDHKGMTILHYYLEKYILIAKQSINDPPGLYRHPRYYRSFNDFKLFLDILVKAGADPCLEDADGNDLLQYCLKRQVSYDLTSFLVKDICKEALNRKSSRGTTPLEVATKECSDDVIILLLEERADPWFRDKHQNNIIHCILSKESLLSGICVKQNAPTTRILVNFLKEYGPQMKNQINYINQVPLMILMSTPFYDLILEEIFDALIPSPGVDREICLTQAVFIATCASGENNLSKRFARISSLVAAGAKFTSEAITIAIKSKTQFLKRLFELKAVPDVDHLQDCLELEYVSFKKQASFKRRLLLFKEVLQHIPNNHRVVKERAPGILLKCLRFMDRSNDVDLDLITLLLNQCNIDLNYTQPGSGSLLHWMAGFQGMEKERTQFVDQLIQMYGDKLDLNILATRPFRQKIGKALKIEVTPLQIAVERGSYRFAQILVKNVASIDNLVFPESLQLVTPGHDDAGLYALIRMLKFMGSRDKHLDVLLEKFESKYPSLVQKSKNPLSLLELSCQTIRRSETRHEIVSLVEELSIFDVDPVKDCLLMNDIQEFDFPSAPS